MFIKCERDLLLENINLVQRAVSVRTTMPILECILLRCNENGFCMMATDQEIAVKTVGIDCDVIEIGSVAIPSKFFSDIVRKLPEGVVAIKTIDKLIVEIKCGSSKFKIMGLNAEEFPELEEIEWVRKYEIKQGVFKNLIKSTVFSICQDATKPNLMGSLIEIEDQNINMVTCDAFRVSFASGGIIGSTGADGSVIVPFKAVSEMQRLITREDDAMGIYFAEKHVQFDMGVCTVVSRLIDGEFINYASIFPDDFKTKVTITRAIFADALERAALISYHENKKNPVRVNIEDNILSLTSNSDNGNVFEELEVDLFGDALEIAFNPKFLIEAVKSIDETEITAEFNTPLSPCVIKPVSGGVQCKYLILPLRLKS